MGVNKDLSDRTEVRHWGDTKAAYLRPGTQDAERPRRGRPPAKIDPDPSNSDSQLLMDQNKSGINNDISSPNLENLNDGGNSRPMRSTRNPSPNYVNAVLASIDMSVPPPNYKPVAGNSNIAAPAAEPWVTTGPPPFGGFLRNQAWTASTEELAFLNNAICRSMG